MIGTGLETPKRKPSEWDSCSIAVTRPTFRQRGNHQSFCKLPWLFTVITPEPLRFSPVTTFFLLLCSISTCVRQRNPHHKKHPHRADQNKTCTFLTESDGKSSSVANYQPLPPTAGVLLLLSSPNGKISVLTIFDFSFFSSVLHSVSVF